MHEYPPGLMCPNIGMSPDKNAESPGARGARPGPTGTLPEARGASSPCPSGVDQARGAEDEELTNLNWLHENLLQNFTLGGPEASPGSSPLFDIEEGAHCDSPSSSCVFPRDTEKDPLKSKPPFSFSLLIYMAIEQSPSKSLPVKDIYGWILDHFPYFSSAPTGWKNSVRHNLSLNKCFRKVEKNLGKVNGKGSLWCVDPEYQPSLVQALKKQRFPASYAFCTPPASPPSASSPPRHLLLRDQSCALKESDIDAATAMMLLNATPELHVNQYDQDRPMDLSRRDRVLVSRDPKQDHNYSSVSLQRRSSHLSPLSTRARRAGSEGFHSDEDSDPGEDRAPPGKRERREARPDLDDELKAAAGSLLHLAGLRSCLETSQRSAKSLKLSRK